MKSLLKVCCAFIFLCLTAIPVHADWVEVESENFIFRGDLRDSDAISLVRDLEGFRANFFSLFNIEPQPERVKVLVYSVKDNRTLKQVYGTDNIGGVYRTDLRGPVFLLTTRRGFGRDKSARYVAFHEYTHHLIATYTQTNYPRWYDEGFANFMATYEQKNGKFTIGRPRQEYGPALGQREFFPTRTMLQSVHRYPFSFNDNGRGASFTRTVFYGQAWLMVHHMQNTPEFMKGSAQYISKLNMGEDALDSWDEAMGMSPEEYDKVIMDYFRRNRFAGFSVPTDVVLEDIPVQTRKISDDEGLRHLADVTLVFSGNDTKFERTGKAYDKAERKLGSTPRILVGRADMAMANGEYDKARDLVAKALQIDPDNLEAHRIGGANEVLAAKDGEGHDNSYEDAREHLRFVLERDPDDPSANYFMVLSYTGEYPHPEEAVSAAKHVVSYYRASQFAEGNMPAIGILLEAGEKELVKMPLQRAAVWSGNPYTRGQAKRLYDQYFGQ